MEIQSNILKKNNSPFLDDYNVIVAMNDSR
jgi:hypothetical protein